MKPYSQDLRNAAVKAYNDGLGSYEKVASIFQIHPKSLQAWVKMHMQGLVQKSRGKGHRPKAFSAEDLERIRQLLNENPSCTLEALRKAIGVNVHLSAYWRTVRGLGFTYKKKNYCERAGACGHHC